LQDFRAGRLGAFASGVPQTLSFGGYQRAAEESEFFTQHFDRIVPWVCCFCWRGKRSTVAARLPLAFAFADENQEDYLREELLRA